MYCKYCKKKIGDNDISCRYCGKMQVSRQSLMQDALKQYPQVKNAFDDVVRTFGRNDFEARAKAMYDTVAAMVDFIYSKCHSPKCESLFDRVEMLGKAKIISSVTYENYLLVMYFYNENEYSTSDEERKICKLLLAELQTFISDYAEKDYSCVSLGKYKIIDFLFYRMWGMVLLLIGIAMIYNSGVFNEEAESMTFGLFTGILCMLMGIGLIFGGRRIALLILKLRFMFN